MYEEKSSGFIIKPKEGGNSDILCDEFVKGVLESGHDVQKINVHKKQMIWR